MSHRDDDDAMNAFDSSPFKLEWTSTGHATEESVYAWLDGALGDVDSHAIERHVHSCAACSAAVAEARGFIAASVRIMNAADLSPRNSQRGVISSEDVARTAAKVVALADKESRSQNNDDAEHANTPSKITARRWYQRSWARAAAVFMLMLTGTYVATRDYKRTTIDGPAVVTAPPPVVPSVSKAAPDKASPAAPVAPSRVVANAEANAERSKAANTEKVVRNDEIRETKAETTSVAPISMLSARAAGVNIAPEPGKASALRNVVTRATAPEQNARNLSTSVASVASSDITKRTITGTVIDRVTSVPLAVASVSVSGTSMIAATDSVGNFVLRDVPSTVQSLMVRRIGYKDATIPIDSGTATTGVAKAELDAAVMMLDQVAVSSLAGRAPASSVSCLVGGVEASGISVPLVRRLTVRRETSTRYTATLSGWPTAIAETYGTLIMNAGRALLGNVTVGNDRMDIELFQQGDNWSGTLREFRGANMRSESIKLTSSNSGPDCRP